MARCPSIWHNIIRGSFRSPSFPELYTVRELKTFSNISIYRTIMISQDGARLRMDDDVVTLLPLSTIHPLSPHHPPFPHHQHPLVRVLLHAGRSSWCAEVIGVCIVFMEHGGQRSSNPWGVVQCEGQGCLIVLELDMGAVSRIQARSYPRGAPALWETQKGGSLASFGYVDKENCWLEGKVISLHLQISVDQNMSC
jgi:hypothetical protein